MDKTLRLRAYAKINLALDIVGRREDGYHLMDMVMQSVSLFDEVAVERTGGSIVLAGDETAMPLDGRNIAHRAAAAFFAATGQPVGCRIEIEKHVPSQAGLGGGSGDGAAVLVALDALCGTHLGTSALRRIGAGVGADIPFMVGGGTARVGGIGEQIEPLPAMPACYILIAKPQVDVPTGSAFAAFDAARDPQRPDTGRCAAAVRRGSYQQLCRSLGNAMAGDWLPPIIEETRRRLLYLGADAACMTGSGAAVFGLFERRGLAQLALRQLCDAGVRSWLCRPVAQGVEPAAGGAS